MSITVAEAMTPHLGGTTAWTWQLLYDPIRLSNLLLIELDFFFVPSIFSLKINTLAVGDDDSDGRPFQKKFPNLFPNCFKIVFSENPSPPT